MQSINLKLAAGAAMMIPFDASLFVYESGVGVPGSGDYRIVVKPDNGNEIVLRPGQRFRTSRTQNWNVRPFDPAVGINGVVVIGSGEFDDASIDQVVRLDGAYNNNVSINNTVAVTGAIVAYTNNFQVQGTTANVPVKVVDASVNTKGVIINRSSISLLSASNGGAVTLLAKAGNVAPASYIDGEVISLGTSGTAGGYVVQNLATDGMLQMPAGRSLWIFPAVYATTGVNSIFYTVL